MDDLGQETSPEVVDETVRAFLDARKKRRVTAKCIYDSTRRLSTTLSR
ncbi:MAG: hypothetical protein ACJZ2G_03390 [Thalassobaculaceae bacterium]